MPRKRRVDKTRRPTLLDLFPEGPLRLIETCGACGDCLAGDLPEPGRKCEGLGGGKVRP